MSFLSEINKLGRKVNKVTMIASNLNALDQAAKGKPGMLKQKVKNRVRKKIGKLIAR
jgi:hypothetical protein